MGFVAGAFFFGFVFFPRRNASGMGVQKKMNTDLEPRNPAYTAHYLEHFKKYSLITKIKRSSIKANFQERCSKYAQAEV